MKRARRRSRVAQPVSLLHALFSRETATISHTHFRLSAHTALVPSSSFINVTNVPNVSFRRFTPCGRFLISMSRNQRDIVIFRLEGGGRRTMPPTTAPAIDFDRAAYHPPAPIALQSDMSLSNPFTRPFTRPSPSDFPHQTQRPFPPPAPHHPLAMPVYQPVAAPNAPRVPDSGLLTQLPVPLPVRARRRDFAKDYTCDFGRFFSRQYELPVATGAELIMREFCLCTPSGRYMIVASFHAQAEGAQVPERPVATDDPPGVANVPSLERVTLHLVEVETGRVADRFVLADDYVQLEGHAGVHMRADVMCVLSIRQQVLYVLKVHEAAGRFVLQARIGDVCRLDDEFEVGRARDSAGFPPEGQVQPERALEKGLGNGKLSRGFYTGLMQKLLVYVYRRYEAEGNKERFYRVVGQYSMLVMLKAQLLDEEHILIKLGTYERSGKPLDAGLNTCFFVVYDMVNGRIDRLFENSSKELLELYERYRDVFVGDGAVLASLPAFRVARDEDGWRHPYRSQGASAVRRTRSALAALPVAAQVRNASVYLDRRIFSYNMDRIAALDGTKTYVSRELSSVKFMSVSRGRLRFKLAAGVPSGERARRDASGMAGSAWLPNAATGREQVTEAVDVEAGTRRKKAVFLFHPCLPFVVSMEFCLSTPTVVNFHAYGHRIAAHG